MDDEVTNCLSLPFFIGGIFFCYANLKIAPKLALFGLAFSSEKMNFFFLNFVKVRWFVREDVSAEKVKSLFGLKCNPIRATFLC